MKKTLIIILIGIMVRTSMASQGPFYVKYGQSVTIDFSLYDANSPQQFASSTAEAGDSKIVKDGNTAVNTTNSFIGSDVNGYRITLTATELSCQRATILIADQTSPKIWADTMLLVLTWGDNNAFCDYVPANVWLIKDEEPPDNNDYVIWNKQALSDYYLDQLLYNPSTSDPCNNSLFALLVSSSETATWSDYDNTASSLTALYADMIHSEDIKILLFGKDANGITDDIWTGTKAGYLDMKISEVNGVIGSSGGGRYDY